MNLPWGKMRIPMIFQENECKMYMSLASTEFT
jgi:hypothetical protein